MANGFLAQSVPFSHKKVGFTLVEVLVSVSIVLLIAVITSTSLTQSKYTEELNSTARLIAGDLRSLQQRAASAENILFCTDGSNVPTAQVCEAGQPACPGAYTCTGFPPAGLGIHFSVSSGSAITYRAYAKVDPSTDGLSWRRSASQEDVFVRSVSAIAGTNVQLDQINGGSADGDIAFRRQNGQMILCDGSGCAPASASLTIRLIHSQTGATKIIVLNSVTGRISIE